jgi:hypothetical protein
MKGEMCILHKIVLKFGTVEGFIMVACRPGCPKHGK